MVEPRFKTGPNLKLCSSRYESDQDAITKDHGLGDFYNRNLSSHSSGGWNSKIKVPAESVSSEASLLGL